MNPNIKRLTEDSGFYLAYDNKEVTEKELEALIQLVVKQCASLTLDYRNYDYHDGWLDYRDEIVYYFGI